MNIMNIISIINKKKAKRISDTFFSKEDKQLIDTTIKRVEAKTTGEVVVALVDASDSYKEARILTILVVSLLGALFFEIFFLLCLQQKSEWSYQTSNYFISLLQNTFYQTSLWRFLFWGLLIYFILYIDIIFFKLYPFSRLLISRYRLNDIVRKRALIAFYDNGLYKTVNHTGVLIFLSLLEKRVWIIGDSGIHQKIGQAFWNKCALELTKGIRKGEAVKALCDIIEKCGCQLELHFPIKDNDVDMKNELPDNIIT
ncbi:MAG: hypothetical protein HQK49_11705 [Oligoflexia bacterium]|nr:hypothetical protein [Oligoflexia bacterium]